MPALAPRRQRPRSAVARRRRSDVRRRRRGRRSVPDGGRGAVGARALRRRLLGRPPAAHPRPDLVGHRAARRPAGRPRARCAARQGPDGRTTSIELTAAGRRAARRRDRRPRRRARGRAGRPLPRRARRPRAPGRARARRASVRRKLARDAGESTRWICRLCDTARMRAPRGPLPGGDAAAAGCCCLLRGGVAAMQGAGVAVARRRRARPNSHHRTGEREIPGEFAREARTCRASVCATRTTPPPDDAA